MVMNKIIFYRNKCIGCGVCYEKQPVLWRMSKKDGKAILLNAANKKNIYILPISNVYLNRMQELALLCPLNIIKIL